MLIWLLMSSLYAQIIDMNCSQLNIPSEQCRQVRNYDSYLSSYNYPLQKLFKDKRCDKGECMAYFINSSCEGCDSAECIGKCQGHPKDESGIVDVLRTIKNKPKVNPGYEVQKVINTIVRTVTVRDPPQESINDSAATRQSEPPSVVTVTYNEVKTITIDQPDSAKTTKRRHPLSKRKAPSRRTKKECADDESSDDNSTIYSVKKKGKPKMRTIPYSEEPDVVNPTVSLSSKQYHPETMSFQPQDSFFNIRENTINNLMPERKISPKDVTVTRIMEKTSILEKPITLYREFTTTVTKDRPIINYKVTTLTDISTKTEKMVVTATKTLMVDKKESKSKQNSNFDAEESSTRNSSTEDKSIIPSENLENECSFLNLKDKCNRNRIHSASKFSKTTHKKSHRPNIPEEKTVTVTASVSCKTDAPEETIATHVKTVTVDPQQAKEKTITVTRNNKMEDRSSKPLEKIVTVTRNNKIRDNAITVTVGSSSASEHVKTVTVEKSIIQNVTVTKSDYDVQTVTVERPAVQSSAFIQTETVEKSVQPKLNIPKNIVITTTFYKPSTSMVTLNVPSVSVITMQASTPNTSIDTMETKNSSPQSAGIPCATDQFKEKSKPKIATKRCEIKNDSKKPRTICRFQHVPKDILKRLVGSSSENRRSRKKRTVYRTVFSTEGSLSKDDDKVVTTTVYE